MSGNDEPVSDDMVERGARALYEMDEKERRGEPGGGTMLPFERLRPEYERLAQAVLLAALADKEAA